MELQLGLALPTTTCSISSKRASDLDVHSYHNVVVGTKKRNLAAALGDDEDHYYSNDDQLRTLPLLDWNINPPRKDDDDDDKINCRFTFDNIVYDQEEEIVGWPPIKFPRKKPFPSVRENNRRVENYGCADCLGRRNYSLYVKVKMEGAAIARKIDLSRYDSLQMLKLACLSMFGIRDENSSSCYKLTYQDKEGDWLLAEDVTWRSFITSVLRLKLKRGGSTS